MNRRPLGCLFEVVETLVLTVVIFLVIQNFVAQPYQVKQESMEHTLQEGQYVLVDKLSPRFDGYSRGDIVVFHPRESGSCSSDNPSPAEASPEGDIPFIKRVIGLPGDSIEIRDGQVLVNKERIDETGYIFDRQPTQVTGDQDSWVVEPNCLFVLGDHRGNSTDSRVFGSVPIKSIVGRAWLRYWPVTALTILPTPTYPALAAQNREGAAP